MGRFGLVAQHRRGEREGPSKRATAQLTRMVVAPLLLLFGSCLTLDRQRVLGHRDRYVLRVDVRNLRTHHYLVICLEDLRLGPSPRARVLEDGAGWTLRTACPSTLAQRAARLTDPTESASSRSPPHRGSTSPSFSVLTQDRPNHTVSTGFSRACQSPANYQQWRVNLTGWGRPRPPNWHTSLVLEAIHPDAPTPRSPATGSRAGPRRSRR